jgi:hypothetical protein
MRFLGPVLLLALTAAAAVASCNSPATPVSCAAGLCGGGGTGTASTGTVSSSAVSSTVSASSNGGAATGGNGGASAAGGGGTSSTGGGGGSAAIVIPEAPECGNTPQPGPGAGDIPCNVFDVMHRRCDSCHNLTGSGAFPILSYQDIDTCYGDDHLRWAIMLDAINPNPMISTPMPLSGGPLSPADLKTMNDWLLGGAKPVAAGQGCFCPEDWPAGAGGASGMGCN